MGDSIETWRARIGRYTGSRSSNHNCIIVSYGLLSDIFGGPFFLQLCLSLFTLTYLLLIAGIEANPGPETYDDLAALIKNSAKETETNITAAIEKVNLSLSNQIATLNDSVSTLQTDLNAANSKISLLEDKIDELESNNRKNNILFFNIPAVDDNNGIENVYNTIIEFCKDKLDFVLQLGDINFCHRFGSSKKGNRPVILSLVHHRIKQALFKNVNLLKDTDFSISDDLTPKGRAQRKLLYQKFIEIKGMGYKNVKKYKNFISIENQKIYYNDLVKDNWLDLVKELPLLHRSDSLSSVNSKGSGNGLAPVRGAKSMALRNRK